MKYLIYYWTLVALCFSFAACDSEKILPQPSTATASLDPTIVSYNSDSRAINDTGHEGIIKKKFVPQDQITVFIHQGEEQEKTYLATLQADGSTWSWEAGNPLLLAAGTDKNSITAIFKADNQPDELVASASDLSDGTITLRFGHSKALLTVEIWGNTQGPISDMKFYDESDTAYPVIDGITLIPPTTRLCKVTFIRDRQKLNVKFKTLELLHSGASYKMNLHLDQLIETGEVIIDLQVQDIASWTDDGAYFNGDWYPRDHIIATEDDLDAFREKINNEGTKFEGEKIILISDLNYAGREPWTTGIKEFSGTFFGNGHTIHNFFIQTTADKPTWYGSEGFIANLLEGGTIDNLHFKDSGINTKSINNYSTKFYIGILTGTNHGTITRCSIVNGNMRGISLSTYYTPGALAGYNDGQIIACHAKADMEGSINDAGGLIGNNYSKGTLFGCYYDGKIYDWGNNDNDYPIGLLIGHSRYNYSEPNVSTIRSCYGIKLTIGSYEGRLLGKPNNYNFDPNYDKLEDLEKNCLLLSNTSEASKADLIQDAQDVTDANGSVWKAEKIWNDDLTINFDYHGEP